MHNIKELRKNLEFYKKKFSERNFNFNIEEFKKLDDKNRKLINEKEKLEQEKILSKLKINLILKNQKRFPKKYQNFLMNKLKFKKIK